MATETDAEMLKKLEDKKNELTAIMLTHKYIRDEDKSNDYPFFLYLASILNFAEVHNDGCLSQIGLKSLALDISPYILVLQSKEEVLSQKDLLRLLLNLVNSFATCVLAKGLIELSKEEPEKFFKLNDYPLVVRDTFEELETKIIEVMPMLKQLIDTLHPKLNDKYSKAFNEEKTKGFVKPIFDASAVKHISSRFPTDLANARECK